MSADRTPDPIDRACEREEELRSQALAAALAAMNESHPDFDGRHCIDCAAEIHILRVEMGRIRCVMCQTEKERREKMYARR